MSFVSIIASTRLVSAVSDGTQVDLNERGDIVMLPGTKPSLIRISENQLIACTGSTSVLHQLKKSFPYKDEAYEMTSAFTGELERAAHSVPFSKQDVLIALADVSGEVICRIISNDPDQDWQTLVPSRDRLAALYLAGRSIDEEHIKEIAAECDRQLQLFGKETPDQIYRVQKSLNQFVASRDTTVGTRVFRIMLNGNK
jgi:hypothetical protein